MALSYKPVDRDQLFLLPPDMREWLPERHLAWFVLEVVGRLDTSSLHALHPNDGVGRQAYDPDMLLGLLIYAYCTGVRSSRQIERLCEVDVAFKVLAAGHVPDHTTIARFRQHGDEAVVQLFTDVLVLCAESGLARVGVVAVDGTKVAADASLKANRTRSQIEDEVRRMRAEATDIDAQEDRLFGDRRGDELPEELVDPRRRKARLDAALRQLDEQRKAREAERQATRERLEGRRREAEEEVAREERRAAEQAERRSKATGKRGGKPHPDGPRKLRRARVKMDHARARAEAADSTAEPKEQANVTDPDSRIMKTRQGWVQGYNAQAAVNDKGVVLAAHVTQEVHDLHQCEPMMAATKANLKKAGIKVPIGTMVFDAGYLTESNLTAPGPDRLIATGKAHRQRADQPTQGPPPEGADPIRAMEHRLRTPEGSAIYAKRQHTVEPVFGDIKHLRGFRRFSRRGITAANSEWILMTIAHNTLKLFRYRLAPT